MRKLSREFERALNREMQERLDAGRARYLSKENSLFYSHGTGSLTTDGQTGTRNTEFKSHSHEVSIRRDDIVGHKLEILPSHMNSMIDGMMRQFVELLYSTVSQAAESVGNVVSGANHPSPAHQFLHMIRKVEFGVGKDGKASMPEIHGGPDVIRKLHQDVMAQGREFRELVEDTIKQKKADAEERERARRARFKKHSP